MTGLRIAWARFRHSLRGNDDGIKAEIDEHLNALAEQYRSEGLGGTEARHAARREFGNATLVHEQYHERSGFPWLEQTLADSRYALRSLAKAKVFTAVAVGSLALGIGANTAIFSFVNAVLLQKLPVPEPDRLVQLARHENGSDSLPVFTLATIERLEARQGLFAGIFGRQATSAAVRTGSEPEFVSVEMVTGEYFKALRVVPALGRLLSVDDVRAAAAFPRCVISYRFWQSHLAGDPAIVNRRLEVNGHSYRILGVTAREFSGMDLQRPADLQVPATRVGDFWPAFRLGDKVDWSRELSFLSVFARLREGASRTEVEARLQNEMREVRRELGDTPPSGRDREEMRLVDAASGAASARGELGRPSVVLLCIVGTLLLATCANLANLLLARASAREPEIATRLALGASRIRVVARLVAESGWLAVGGCISGLLVAAGLSRMLLLLLNQGRTTAFTVVPDARVFLFTAAVTVGAVTLFGLIPAMHTVRSLAGKLAVESRTTMRSNAWLRRALVVSQVALSLVLLFTAALLTRTLRNLDAVNVGFEPARVLALEVRPASAGMNEEESGAFYEELRRRTLELPGAEAASLASAPPLSGGNRIAFGITVPGYRSQKGEALTPGVNFVGQDYFRALHQPILEGREFGSEDTANSPRVAIVNQSFVRHYFGGGRAEGRIFRIGTGPAIRIVGVAANVNDIDIRERPGDIAYLPFRQGQSSSLTVLVRTSATAVPLAGQLRSLVRSVDARVPVLSVRTLKAQIEASLSKEQVLSLLSTLFAALALALALIGLYGVVAYSVVRRTREIGLRVAVGAQGASVAWLFLREVLTVVALGLVFGVPAGLAVARLLASQLYGLSPHDLPMLGMSAGLLATAALAATLVPVRQAVRIDPVRALYHE